MKRGGGTSRLTRKSSVLPTCSLFYSSCSWCVRHLRRPAACWSLATFQGTCYIRVPGNDEVLYMNMRRQSEGNRHRYLFTAECASDPRLAIPHGGGDHHRGWQSEGGGGGGGGGAASAAAAAATAAASAAAAATAAAAAC